MKTNPPKTNKIFVAKWNSLLPDVMARDNFKPGHLFQLEILCDLYVEYQDLLDSLELTGPTFVTTDGRNGTQVKMRPEVNQLNRVRAEIRNYSKHLGLLLVKDTETSEGSMEDEFK